MNNYLWRAALAGAVFGSLFLYYEKNNRALEKENRSLRISLGDNNYYGEGEDVETDSLDAELRKQREDLKLTVAKREYYLKLNASTRCLQSTTKRLIRERKLAQDLVEKYNFRVEQIHGKDKIEDPKLAEDELEIKERKERGVTLLPRSGVDYFEDDEMYSVREELAKQERNIRLNEKKIKLYVDLQNSTEKLTNALDALDQLRTEATVLIENYNSDIDKMSSES